MEQVLDEKRWETIVTSVEEASLSLKKLLKRANRSLALLDKTIKGVDGLVVRNDVALEAALNKFEEAMEQARVFLQKGHSLIKGTESSLSHLTRHLLVVGRNMETASENLERLTDLLADQPSRLLFGGPSSPRKVHSEQDGQ